MKKKILIGLGIVIVAAGITLGVLYIIKLVNPAPIAQPQGSTSKDLVLDHSKDYGACNILQPSVIQSALGKVADNLQASQDMGITKDQYYGDGVQNVASDSQTCIFAFAPGGNASNGFNATNAFSVQRTNFSNSDGPKSVIAQAQKNKAIIKISGLGDAALFTANNVAKGPGAVYSFYLQVFDGSKATLYSIVEPADANAFTAEAAQAALVQIAKAAVLPN